MNYSTVINNVNGETSSFIRVVLRIFKQLSGKAIQIGGLQPRGANSEDIKIMSIIGASLYCNCSCKNIFGKYGIDFNIFARCFNLNMNIADNKISEKENEEIYDKYFASKIDDIIDEKLLSSKPLEIVFPEIIVLNSITSSSNVFDIFFDYCDKNSTGTLCNTTQAIKDIKSSYESRVPKTQDNVKDSFNKPQRSSFGDRYSRPDNDFGDPYQDMFAPQDSYRGGSALKKYGVLLNDKEFKTNPAVEREEEIDKTIEAICTFRRHPMLTGAPGVGKTAIVEGIAYRIKNGTIGVDRLVNAKIYKIDINSLLGNTGLRGSFEGKVESLLKEASEDKNIILFFDEIHNALGAGRAMGAPLDLANALKSYLDRESIKIIAATTDEEYDEYVKSDEAFKRRFKRIKILEPADKAVVGILENLVLELENYNNVKFGYSDSAKKAVLEFIVSSTNKTSRPWDDKSYNPDLSISILCNAFAIAEGNKDEKVTIEHIKKALIDCEGLYLGSRTDSANKLDKVLEIKKEAKGKIIPFPSR